MYLNTNVPDEGGAKPARLPTALKETGSLSVYKNAKSNS